MQQKKPPYASARQKERPATDPKRASRKTRGGKAGRDVTPATGVRGTGNAVPRLLEEADDLPVMYDDTRLVLTVIDPFLVNVRWDLNPRQVTRAKKASVKGGRTSLPVLRFHEVAGPVFTDDHIRSRFDVEIDLEAGNWYVPLWSADRTYFVDLGFKTTGGDFYPLARSNTAVVPPSGPDEKDAAHLILVTEEMGMIEAVEVAPAEPLQPPLGTAPGGEGGPRKDGALPSTVPEARPSMPPSPTTGARRPVRDHAIGIEVLWALPEKAEYSSAGEQLTTTERTDAFDLVARAEGLFTPGVSS